MTAQDSKMFPSESCVSLAEVSKNMQHLANNDCEKCVSKKEASFCNAGLDRSCLDVCPRSSLLTVAVCLSVVRVSC
ncbi:hypothetical protein NP493_1359g00042 [Ridgeia piscesae]|uniref:Uncharacterized protein n=1 Tax=Ridgeia piscesae TaxID=27915 RepID=A0AAD9K635_RIDPI|nr:hypothetical protein NP493_1359g00042 [Ridgeia piscesae]